MYIFILYASCIAIILFGIYHYINIKGDYEENPDKKYDIIKRLSARIGSFVCILAENRRQFESKPFLNIKDY